MKEAFRNQKVTVKRMLQIDDANEILMEYKKQGYKLTLRQLYYQLVSRGVIPNEVQEYQKLMRTCVIGRMNGLIDWGMIEDRVRFPYLTYAVNSIEEAIEDTVEAYKLHRQKGQKNHIEIWTEKDAVSNILKRSSSYFHIHLMINRGYSSCSAMYQSALRMTSRDKPVKILYVGDHDPSGLDMLRDIEERLHEFRVDDFEVIPVALTMGQILEYSPPPNPTKTTDPRADWYINEYGDESWELDALKPEVLEKITEKAILEYLDPIQFNKMTDKEKRDKKKISNMMKNL